MQREERRQSKLTSDDGVSSIKHRENYIQSKSVDRWLSKLDVITFALSNFSVNQMICLSSLRSVRSRGTDYRSPPYYNT